MDSRQLGLENAEAQNAEAQNASNDGQQMTKTNVKMPWTNFIKYFTSVIYVCL
jgi:hypothetical protein